MNNEMLEKAISIAVKAHKGQVDKAGEAYILHPLRVMLIQKDNDSKIVAVLHDVLEDSEWLDTDLLDAGFSSDILTSLDCLTHKNGENYFDYIHRVQTDEIATMVKLADLNDNMDLRRIKNPTDKDYERQRKYQKALDILMGLSE